MGYGNGWLDLTGIDLLDPVVKGTQNPESAFIPNEVGIATQRVPGHLRGHMHKHKLTRHVHRAEYANPASRRRIGVTECIVGIIP